jgi:hypothetical protein
MQQGKVALRWRARTEPLGKWGGLEGPVACFAKEDFCKCQPERLVVPNRYKNLYDEILLYEVKTKGRREWET